jgi:hypothetical protein
MEFWNNVSNPEEDCDRNLHEARKLWYTFFEVSEPLAHDIVGEEKVRHDDDECVKENEVHVSIPKTSSDRARK